MSFSNWLAYLAVRALFVLGCGVAGGIFIDGITTHDASAGAAAGCLAGLLCFGFRRISSGKALALRNWQAPL